jgi:Na+/proline symporter
MILADFVAWLGMGFSVIIFILLATKKSTAPTTIESVLLADRQVKSRQFGTSFAAASTSLATVLIFFISTSQFYGIFLLWCGLTYLLGQALFLWWMDSINIDTRALTSNADFVLDQTQSKSAARCIAAMTTSAFLLILFLELYIGSEILSYYFNLSAGLGKGLAFLGLGFTVILYVQMGGLKVVLRTDVWQYYLMICACLALLAFAILVPKATTIAEVETAVTWFGSASNLQVGLFMAWILILNFTLPFTQLSSWQRLAATSSIKEAVDGLIKSIPGFLIIWMLPVIALVLLGQKGFNSTTLSGLFDILRGGNNNLTLAFYPFIFVGFASALFSTADTALIALQFSVADRTTLGPKLDRMDERSLKRFFLIIIIITVLALAAVYSLAEADLGSWFVPLVYTIFSLLTISGPQVIYSILERSGRIKNRDFTPLSSFFNVLGIVVGCIILIVTTIAVATGKIEEPLGYQEIATYLATFSSIIGLFLAVLCARVVPLKPPTEAR